MTRIIAGRFGGRRLTTPRTADTRPTSDRAREALFSRLDHHGLLTGARVLDLFAGSGGLGLEALSRGAAHTTFVDSARAAQTCLRENVATLGLDAAQALVWAETAAKVLGGAPPSEPYDIVLLDPPYALDEEELATLLARLVVPGWCHPDAVVVVERAARGPEPTWPDGLVRYDERRYGEAVLWFAELDAGAVDTLDG